MSDKDSSAYKRGYCALRHGLHINPYDIDQPEFEQWNSGWDDAYEDLCNNVPWRHISANDAENATE